MEKFKEKIRIRTIWMVVVIICIAITYSVLLFNQDNLTEISDFIKGFQTGAFCGLQLILIYSLVRNLASMRNEKALRKLYIEENDERTIMIMQKTGAMGITICITGLAFAAVIAGFYNQIAFFSLLGATVFTALVKGFFKIYYHHKF